jgi:hypothetical protein
MLVVNLKGYPRLYLNSRRGLSLRYVVFKERKYSAPGGLAPPRADCIYTIGEPGSQVNSEKTAPPVFIGPGLSRRVL